MPLVRSTQNSYAKRIPRITTALASTSNKTNKSLNSNLNICGNSKIQYITDSIWSYSPEYIQQRVRFKF
jgi:hypothetical protein